MIKQVKLATTFKRKLNSELFCMAYGEQFSCLVVTTKHLDLLAMQGVI